MKNTKVYLMSTENVKDPRTFALWKEFLPKEHWEKTVRPLKEEDRKTELAAWFLLYQALIFLILGNMYCVQYQKWKLAVILKR